MKKEDYMLRAINLAKKAKFHTNPNPRVGCVIVKNNKVIGEGFHKKYGGTGKKFQFKFIDYKRNNFEKRHANHHAPGRFYRGS